jgi:type VI secretion system protein ImpL
LKELLVAIARQLTLSEPPKPSAVEAAAAADLEKAAKAKAAAVAPTVARSAALAALLAGQAGAAPALPPGHEIDERYRQLRDLVTPPGSAPIDQVAARVEAALGGRRSA